MEPPRAVLCKIPCSNAMRAPALFAHSVEPGTSKPLSLKLRSSFPAFPHPALQAEIRDIICLGVQSSRSGRRNKWCLLISAVFS